MNIDKPEQNIQIKCPELEELLKSIPEDIQTKSSQYLYSLFTAKIKEINNKRKIDNDIQKI